MVRANIGISNLVGGELDPTMQGRYDLPIYKRGLDRAENFIIKAQGSAQYRPGTMYVHHTRRNAKAWLMPFQFSDEQAYVIEMTQGYFRFYRNNNIIVESALTVTGVTQANPAVVTVTGHGLSDGDEVFINDVAGMTELNGKSYVVDVLTANTFALYKGTDGTTAIDSTGYTAYSSGGSVEKIYEIVSPYLQIHNQYVLRTQNADTAYMTLRAMEPRKLTRSGHTNWTLARYARTNDPFATAKTITGVATVNPAQVTVTGHGWATGDQVYIDSVVGTTEVNNSHYLIVVTGANTFTLQDLDGNAVDGSAWTAYTSGGKAEFVNGLDYPRAVTFTDSARLMYGGTGNKPETVFASRAPSSGATRYEDHTTGSADTDAVQFTLAPINGKVDSIQWMSSTDKFVIVGTFGTVRRMYGTSEDQAITANAITAKSANNFGCALIAPVVAGTSAFYVQRGTKKLRSVEYDYVIDGYATTDRNLIADHVARSGFIQLIDIQGDFDGMWAVRNDGILIGLTYKEKEDISGWHRHKVGGSHTDDNSVVRPFARVLSVAEMPRPTEGDQLWAVVERTIDGATYRSVEYMADAPEYPDYLDFFTGKDNEVSDKEKYYNALYETQKRAVHVDAAIEYDGSSFGTAADATLTFAAASGTSIAVSADNNVFTSSMVGREIWKKYDVNGDGGGRATITAFTDAQNITVDIDVNLDSTADIAPGDWYLTATSFTGLDHLEGETVKVITDGGTHPDRTVADGAITLSKAASVVYVGLGYTGILKTLPIDLGGVTGTAVTKPKNVNEVAFRFYNTVGVEFGTNPYKTKDIVFTNTAQKTSRPTPPFTGIWKETYSDKSERDKALYVFQNDPLPCTVLIMDVFAETADE